MEGGGLPATSQRRDTRGPSCRVCCEKVWWNTGGSEPAPQREGIILLSIYLLPTLNENIEKNCAKTGFIASALLWPHVGLFKVSAILVDS